MNNSETFETDHPIIKEIKIGEKFVNNRGDILQFIEYYGESFRQYSFIFILLKEQSNYLLEFKSIFTKKYGYSLVTYTTKLKYYNNPTKESEPYDISIKLIPLKDKIDLL